ncbi:MAG: hypothetical protein GU346_03575 [Thermocrinis sp.]|jgi:hypothetical protein|nr:hypothetical protein [Thermocrinis sp.]
MEITEKVNAEPLNLRHGKIGLVFEVYPQIHQSLYTLPISFPQEWRQRLYVETTTPYYTKEELQDVNENGRPKAKILPFTGGPFVHPRDMWELVKSLREFMNRERDKIYISLVNNTDRDPMCEISSSPNGEKALVYLRIEGKTNSGVIKRGRIGFDSQELNSFLRYLTLHAQMEMTIIKERQVAIFRRWTEEFFSYDVAPTKGIITPQRRAKVLKMLYEYLQGNRDLKPVDFGEKLIFKVDKTSGNLLIITTLRPPIELTLEEVKELYMFLS